MSQQAETEILSTIEAQEKIISLGDAVVRLRKNEDFKRIVEEGYFKDNAVRLVHALAAPAISHSEKATAAVHNEMQAIALFRDFLVNICKAADKAEDVIAQNRQELEFVRGEAAEEEAEA